MAGRSPRGVRGLNIQQAADEVVGDIPNIGASGLHVGAVHIGKGGGKAVACGLYRIFRRSMLFGKDGQDAFYKGGVFQKHGVDRKNRGGLDSHIPGCLVVEPRQRDDGALLGEMETVNLFLLGELRHSGNWEGMAVIKVQGSGGNLILNRSSDNDLHGDAPFPGRLESTCFCGSDAAAAWNRRPEKSACLLHIDYNDK